LEDKIIIAECKRADPKYQKILLEKYSDYLASAARNYVSDSSSIMDILQETWIIIFNNIEKYEERGYFYPWAKRIMLREIIRASKKDKAKILLIDTLKNRTEISQPSVESQLELEEAMKLIEQINSPAKEVFKLKIIDELSHKEIAEIMSIKESTSRVHLTNARKQLKELLTVRDKRKTML